MRARRPLLTILAALLLPAAVNAADFRIPRGFREIDRAQGIVLLQRRRDFVQVVSPQEGARLRVLHGQFYEMGLVGAFLRRNIEEWWKEWSSHTPRAFSLVNGQFFDASDADTAPLAFAIKADGKVYEGYADADEFPGKKLLLLLGADQYRIVPYYDDSDELLVHPEPDIVVGLSPSAAKTSSKPIPRTFLGLTRDGRVVIFSSSSASQAYATRALRSFGIDADQILMLDGGNSSHLVHEGRVLVPRSVGGDRRIGRERLPQVVGVERGGDANE